MEDKDRLEGLASLLRAYGLRVDGPRAYAEYGDASLRLRADNPSNPPDCPYVEAGPGWTIRLHARNRNATAGHSPRTLPGDPREAARLVASLLVGLRPLRLGAGLTQEGLGRALGTTGSRIGQYERGALDPASMSYGRMRAMAATLGVTMDVLDMNLFPADPSDPLPAPDSEKPMPEPPARDLPWDPDPWNA